MRNLFNLIAIIATAFTMFYLGKSYGINQEQPIPFDDHSGEAIEMTQQLVKMELYLDSIKEENREMDMMIVGYQDTLKVLKASLKKIGKRRADTVTLVEKCNEDFAEYRIACETFVQESDSIISAMYVSGRNKDKIIDVQDSTIIELSMKYTQSVYLAQATATGEQLEKKRKNKWKTAAIWLAAALGLSLFAR